MGTVTRQEVTLQLRRLSAIYGVPEAARVDREMFEREWTRILARLDHAELEHAVSAYLETAAEYWPKPGQLLVWAKARRSPADKPCVAESYEPASAEVVAAFSEQMRLLFGHVEMPKASVAENEERRRRFREALGAP